MAPEREPGRRWEQLPAAGLSVERADELRETWCRWLARWRWDWFATLTFAEPLPASGIERLEKAWRYWIAETEREALGRRRGSRRAPLAWWVRADEPHRSGALHCHALIGWPAGRPRPTYRQGAARWIAAEGWAKIEPPGQAAAVAEYVSKYVCKDKGNGNLTLGGNLRPYLGHAAGGGERLPGFDGQRPSTRARNR